MMHDDRSPVGVDARRSPLEPRRERERSATAPRAHRPPRPRRATSSAPRGSATAAPTRTPARPSPAPAGRRAGSRAPAARRAAADASSSAARGSGAPGAGSRAGRPAAGSPGTRRAPRTRTAPAPAPAGRASRPAASSRSSGRTPRPRTRSRSRARTGRRPPAAPPTSPGTARGRTPTVAVGSVFEPENRALNTPMPSAASHSGATPANSRAQGMPPRPTPASRTTIVRNAGGQIRSVNASPTSHTSAITSFTSGLVRPRTLDSCASDGSRRSMTAVMGASRDDLGVVRPPSASSTWTMRPASIRTIRPANASMNRSSWVAASTAAPLSTCAARISSSASWPRRSWPYVGSSRTRTDGLRTSADASDRRRCSPPDSVYGLRGPNRPSGQADVVHQRLGAPAAASSRPSITSSSTRSRANCCSGSWNTNWARAARSTRREVGRGAAAEEHLAGRRAEEADQQLGERRLARRRWCRSARPARPASARTRRR